MNGQLYIVLTNARLRDTLHIETCKFIVSAENKEDVEARISHYIDLSQYQSFNISSIKRLKPNFYLLNRHVKEPNEERSVVADLELSEQIPTDEGGLSASVTLQNGGKHMFAFGLIGDLCAKNQRSALLTLSNFLAKKALGSNVHLPFSNSGHFIIEELGESDSTRISNLSKNDPYLVRQTRPVSGGGCSPR